LHCLFVRDIALRACEGVDIALPVCEGVDIALRACEGVDIALPACEGVDIASGLSSWGLARSVSKAVVGPAIGAGASERWTATQGAHALLSTVAIPYPPCDHCFRHCHVM